MLQGKTRELVRETAREFGYVPNRAARTLATGRTHRISFCSPAIGARFFQELTCRFNRLLQQDHYEMIAGEFGPQIADPSGTVFLPQMLALGLVTDGAHR